MENTHCKNRNVRLEQELFNDKNKQQDDILILNNNNLNEINNNNRNNHDEDKELQKKLKSLDALKIQQDRVNQWLIEDKAYLKINISITSLSNFVSGDFELKDENVNGQNELTQITNWIKIQSKSNEEQKTNNNNLKNEDQSLISNNNNSNNNKTNNNGELKINNNIGCTNMNLNNNNSSNKITNNNNNSNSVNNQNVILKNKIIKLSTNCLNLRSLCVQCEINLLMSGESNFYIFSRCTDKFSNQTALCCISKELESARKFISFAILEPKDNDANSFYIRNLKKQEIPKQENYIKSLDISEIKFTFIDNGDNKTFIFLDDQEQNSNLAFVGDFYLPFTDKSNLMFGVTGDLISLKKLIIKQNVRNSLLHLRNIPENNVQSCNCCFIY